MFSSFYVWWESLFVSLFKALILNIFGFRNRPVFQGKGTGILENVFKLRLQKYCSACLNHLNSTVCNEVSLRFLNSTVAIVAAVDIEISRISISRIKSIIFFFYASFGDIINCDNKYRIYSDKCRASNQVCLSKPYHFKFFKGCLPQILLGPFLNTLAHMTIA